MPTLRKESPDLYREFLCACLRSDCERASALVRDPRWNWEYLFQIATAEMLLPALHDRVPDPPSEISDFLSAVESLSAERNEAIFDELETVVRLLNKAGVEPVLLKGAAYIVSGVYTNPAARFLQDIDLLIPERAMPHAIAALREGGYIEDYPDHFEQFRHHHPPLRRPGCVPIELHRSPGQGKCASLLPSEEVLERSSSLEFRGLHVRIPCPEHLMMHLIMHSQIQHPYSERISPPLRAMYDLVLLERRFRHAIDWPAIERRFRTTRQHGVLVLHLLQVHETLSFPLPFDIPLSPLTRLRLLRRKLLQRAPALRYLDPIYISRIVLLPHLRVVRNALSAPGGWKHIVRRLLEPEVYARLMFEVVHGRAK